MELLLIRHGLPIHKVNSDGTPADPPLSDLGREQARLVGEWLAEERIDRIYSSPMLRARETAEPLARFMNVKIELEPRVREFDADAVEYIPMEKLKRDHPERWREFVAGGYASQTDFAAFVSTVTTGLQQLIDANSGRRIAVFCHGGVAISGCWIREREPVPRGKLGGAQHLELERSRASARPQTRRHTSLGQRTRWVVPGLPTSPLS